MKTVHYLLFLITVLFFFATQAFSADVLRCKGQEVRMGDSTFSVLQKCGQPAFQEVISAEGCEKVEKWHYDCKGRRFTDELIFKAGVLKSHKQTQKSGGTQNCNE